MDSRRGSNRLSNRIHGQHETNTLRDPAVAVTIGAACTAPSARLNRANVSFPRQVGSEHTAPTKVFPREDDGCCAMLQQSKVHRGFQIIRTVRARGMRKDLGFLRRIINLRRLPRGRQTKVQLFPQTALGL